MQLFERIDNIIAQVEGGSRAAFARRIDVAQTTFNGYLTDKGQEKIRVSLLEKILECYPEINREWLYFGTGSIWAKGYDPSIRPVRRQQVERRPEAPHSSFPSQDTYSSAPHDIHSRDYSPFDAPKQAAPRDEQPRREAQQQYTAPQQPVRREEYVQPQRSEYNEPQRSEYAAPQMSEHRASEAPAPEPRVSEPRMSAQHEERYAQAPVQEQPAQRQPEPERRQPEQIQEEQRTEPQDAAPEIQAEVQPEHHSEHSHAEELHVAEAPSRDEVQQSEDVPAQPSAEAPELQEAQPEAPAPEEVFEDDELDEALVEATEHSEPEHHEEAEEPCRHELLVQSALAEMAPKTAIGRELRDIAMILLSVEMPIEDVQSAMIEYLSTHLPKDDELSV